MAFRGLLDLVGIRSTDVWQFNAKNFNRAGYKDARWTCKSGLVEEPLAKHGAWYS